MAASFPDPAIDLTKESGPQTAVFAGGCFWCTEAVFELVDGVTDVISGYTGGAKETALYDLVCGGRTGHAEAILITYDPEKTSFGQLLKIFFSVAHDPTQLNRQGHDVGTQYRSAIFYVSEEQKQVAEAYVKQLNDAHAFSSPIVTQIAPLDKFYSAEAYHQDYARNNRQNPYIVGVSDPKVEKLKKMYPGCMIKPEPVMVKIAEFDDTGHHTGDVIVPKIQRSEEEWREELNDTCFRVTREQGTERPFTGTLNKNYEDGIYRCACCGTALFTSETKFDSGTGWPSFWAPIAKENVASYVDNAHGMQRVENRCARCDAHLGHVFPDGPKGTRYCMNSASLKFVPRAK